MLHKPVEDLVPLTGVPNTNAVEAWECDQGEFIWINVIQLFGILVKAANAECSHMQTSPWAVLMQCCEHTGGNLVGACVGEIFQTTETGKELCE